jgi:hypothetical protein
VTVGLVHAVVGIRPVFARPAMAAPESCWTDIEDLLRLAVLGKRGIAARSQQAKNLVARKRNLTCKLIAEGDSKQRIYKGLKLTIITY